MREFTQEIALLYRGHPLKKSLLLAALLLSSAAQADVYFCSTKGISTILSKGGFNPNEFASAYSPNGSDEVLNFVVDTNRGFRGASEVNSLYQGSCQILDEENFSTRTTCIHEDTLGIASIYVRELPDEILFTYSEHSFGISVSSSAGICTKV
jgi:hypothetical protein